MLILGFQGQRCQNVILGFQSRKGRQVAQSRKGRQVAQKGRQVAQKGRQVAQKGRREAQRGRQVAQSESGRCRQGVSRPCPSLGTSVGAGL